MERRKKIEANFTKDFDEAVKIAKEYKEKHKDIKTEVEILESNVGWLDMFLITLFQI